MSMGPQLIDPTFSRHLDLTFTVNGDKYEKHRALHLLNVSRQLSGSYMCKVSSFLDEDFNQRSVMIYGTILKGLAHKIEMELRLVSVPQMFIYNLSQ